VRRSTLFGYPTRIQPLARGYWMEYEWNMNGIWMEYEWNMNGIWMECIYIYISIEWKYQWLHHQTIGFFRGKIADTHIGQAARDIVKNDDIVPAPWHHLTKMKLECLTEVPHVYRLFRETYGKFKESTGFVPKRGQFLLLQKTWGILLPGMMRLT